jgi:DNA-binding LacI/PurR family transcriptional regulator
VTRQRWQGLQSVWVDHGGSPDWCVPAPYDTFRNLSLKDQVHKMVAALVETREITAYVCFNESVATYVLQALSQYGKRVPFDASVVTFGDSPSGAEAFSPPLTTVRAPSSQIANTAIAQLYALHGQGDDNKPFVVGDHRRDISYPGELIIRGSCIRVEVS